MTGPWPILHEDAHAQRTHFGPMSGKERNPAPTHAVAVGMRQAGVEAAPSGGADYDYLDRCRRLAEAEIE
jgi:hypothetical protein